MAQVNHRKSHTIEPSLKQASQKSPSVGWLVLLGAVQGLIMGAVVGGFGGLYMWRSMTEDLAALSVPNCTDCPQAVCPASQQCVIPSKCIALSSDTFMKAVSNVRDYHNKRLHPEKDVFNADELAWIIKNSQADQTPAGTTLTFPRQGPWAFIYQRIHDTVLAQNEQLWQYRLPKNFTSELVEDIVLNIYDKTVNNTFGDKEFFTDIGVLGGVGKRILSAAVPLNADCEGGQLSSLLNLNPYDMPNIPGMLWIWPSFMPKRHLPVTRGTQYMLLYWVRRY